MEISRHSSGHADSAAADAYSDDYATHVVNIGGQTPLSDAQLSGLRESVSRSVDDSRGRLVDQHTTDMIRDTVLGALDRSPTFRAAVSYGLQNHQVDLGDIAYSNEYESNCFATGEDMPRPLSELTLDDVRSRGAQAPALFPNTVAIRLTPGHARVSMGAAPNTVSPYMPAWQEALIHEIMHHVTGSGDPRGSGENQQGPTELLARRVADEMGWDIPVFRGYGDPARTAYICERNYAGLSDTLRRNPGHERELFGRLDIISFGGFASVDFRNP